MTVTRRRWAIACAGTALVMCAGAGRVQARSTFTINNQDAPGNGFNDATPAAPVGGNMGTTVGQQRMNVFREAGALWGRVLDSPVPIVVDAAFGPLACSAERVTLGQAQAAGLEVNRPGLPPDVYFPEALADRIAEVDLFPGEADIYATFNGELAACTGGLQDWYYGFDGKPPSGDIDLLSVVLHELGHGLGFSTSVDKQTGELAGEFSDSFTAHVFDNSVGLAWTQMTPAQRAASASNLRHLVWNGANVRRVAPQALAMGAPRIMLTPAVAGFTGALGEANFGPFLAAGSRTGRLLVGNPTHGCALPPSYQGAIVLLSSGVCPSVQKTSFAQDGGAVAVLIADPVGMAPPSSVEVPPDQRSMFTVSIPALGLGEGDAALLAAAAATSTNVALTADATRLVGADEQGRVYLYASDPVLSGSTVSHWDPLVRPSAIMEPDDTYEVSHALTLEAALMRDIGWAPFCGNGRPDPEEQCDSGPSNSDTAPGACRTTCMRARCGDAVVDPGEQCDAAANSDSMPGACRTTCMSARCGDAVVDPGEQCDAAAANSDSMPGACRTTCMSARCGDAVVDPGEQCDDGAANGPGAPCGPTCVKAPPEEKGCGCALGAGGSNAPSGGAALLLLALAAAVRARPRRGAATGTSGGRTGRAFRRRGRR